MVKTLCIVQARLTSSRLPNKVLMELGNTGLTLLEHVYQRLSLSKEIDKTVFAVPNTTSNDKLACFLEEKHIPYFRGSEKNVLERFYKCALQYSPQLIVRATCDNPCVDWMLADLLISSMDEFDYVTCRDTPLGTAVEVFTMEALDQAYNSSSSELEKEHVSPFIYNHPDKFKCKSILFNGLNYRLTVDEPADLQLINCIFKSLYINNPIPNLTIYQFLESHPHLLELNTDVRQNTIK